MVFLQVRHDLLRSRRVEGADNTIIDCKNTVRGFNFLTNEDTTATVHGFTITNGYAISFGGAIRCENASPTIADCILSNNNAAVDGGAIDCWNSSPVISNCKITENRAGSGYGGGISCYEGASNPTIVNCEISGNIAATLNGGGISCYGASPTITNNLIIGNLSASYGGGIWSYRGSAKITSCTFSLNDAIGCGSGIACDDSSPTITDCILWDDVTDEICVISGSPVVTYSDVENGTGQPWFGTGCIDKDPLFVAGPLHDYLSEPRFRRTGRSTARAWTPVAPLQKYLVFIALNTRTNGGKDIDTVDMGYHVTHTLYIYNIKRTATTSRYTGKTRLGASYTVQRSNDLIDLE